MKDRPRILLFTGDGKGKTTAALGMALRASGHGMRTLVVQFVKCDPSTGELEAARHLPGIEIEQHGLGFVPASASSEFVAHKQAAAKALRRAQQAIASGEYRLVILDEVCYAVTRELIEEREVSDVVNQAPADCIIVMTGRGATEGLIALADTVTEMRSVKHGFEAGRSAEKGVEL